MLSDAQRLALVFGTVGVGLFLFSKYLEKVEPCNANSNQEYKQLYDAIILNKDPSLLLGHRSAFTEAQRSYLIDTAIRSKNNKALSKLLTVQAFSSTAYMYNSLFSELAKRIGNFEALSILDANELKNSKIAALRIK